MLRRILEKIPKGYVIAIIIFTIVFSLMNVFYTNILSNLTSDVLNGSTNELAKLAIMYVAYLFVWEILEYFGDNFIILGEIKCENNLGPFLLKKIYKLKPTVIQKYNTGYINGVVSAYKNQKWCTVDSAVIMTPLSLIYIAYSFIKMSQFNVMYGIALIAVLTTSILFRYAGKNKTEQYAEELTTAESNRNKHFIDTTSNIGTAQKMESIDYLISLYEIENDKCVVAGRKFARHNELFFAGFKFIIFLYLPVICLLYYIFPDSVSDPVKFFSFVAVSAMQLVGIAKNICHAMIDLMKFKAKCNKLDEIVGEDNVRAELLGDVDFHSAEILNVEYSFHNKDSQVTTTVRIPKFKVEKGDKICVYGESGQGKTTTLNILSGEIQTGQVLINGKESDKRLDCCYIAQDNSIFDLTLRDNLALGRNVTDDEIINLIDKCGLKDWYDRQADGLETVLGERGVFVSTGQRQRLNLIRGLLVKDKEIYLLDEPTSNVDDETEDRMIQTINEYLGDKTVVIVTHRPKIKSMCNKSYKFENGTCVEE